jgi:predicted MPP superfamily phosphohydrolase
MEFGLAQISDVHLPGNQTASRAALEHLHQERPDIVVLTGDMTESREPGSGPGCRGGRLTLVGLDDPVEGAPDLKTARRNVIPGSTEIWLVHAPGYLEQPPAGTSARPALLLAGHTHGGQIRIPLLPPVKPTGAGRFLEGWYHDTFAPLYVSRGVGTTGIPARFCVRLSSRSLRFGRLEVFYSPGSMTTAVPLALTISMPPPEPTWIVS